MLSLRVRLLLLILLPLLLVTFLSIVWRYALAQRTADEIFDRTLIALTLAISRDVIVSGGDSLSTTTAAMVRSAGGGEIFYHVNGPDGSFKTGYAYPPIRPKTAPIDANKPLLFKARLRGEPVRAAQLKERVTIENVTGFAIVTVWQTLNARDQFARKLTLSTAMLIGLLTLTVAGLVWFGIRLGLRPLHELQEAIAKRSSNDLSPIRRAVPKEVQGVVATLNSLLKQVSDSMNTRDRFISDAAHQLRNPIAAIQSMAEAVNATTSIEEKKIREAELIEATRHASRLSNQLLSYERAKSRQSQLKKQKTDITSLVEHVCQRNATHILNLGINFEFDSPKKEVFAAVDPLLVEEAIQNLIDNALLHGGSTLNKLLVSVNRAAPSNNALGYATIIVSDNGVGIANENSSSIFERFVQGYPSSGSGLGLSIVQQVAQAHDGYIGYHKNSEDNTGALFKLSLPL